ncbi:YhdP family protein [Advenella faeciporci]|nr:AsmA-like C-terminal region-containing protein [Advenella faeciporci]
MSVARKILRYCLVVFIGFLILLAALSLGVRYFLVPNLPQWLPQIQAYISKTLDMDVRVEQLSLAWEDSPVLQLEGVTIENSEKNEYLKIKSVSAGVNWLDLLRMRPFLSEISINNAALSIRRDSSGSIRLLGQVLVGQDKASVPDTAVNNGELSSLAGWLESLSSLSLRQTDLIWIDEQSQARPLVLSGVTLDIKRAHDELDVSFFAHLPEQLGHSLALDATLKQAPDAEGPLQFSGKINARLNGLSLLDLAPWVNIPGQLRSGYLNHAAIVLEMDRNKIGEISLDAEARDFRLEDHLRKHAFIVASGLLRLKLDTSFSNIQAEIRRRLRATNAEQMPHEDLATLTPWAFSFMASQFFYDDKTSFNEPVSLDQTNVTGRFERDEQQFPWVSIQQGSIKNDDIDINVSGSWHFDPNSDNGIVDLQGDLHSLKLPHLYRYLPNVIDEDALDWLTHAFKDGQLDNAPFTLKGVVDHFPFGLRSQSGDFQVKGDYKNLALDYHQEEIKGRKWPIVYSENGSFDFRRDKIALQSGHAYFLIQEDQKIDLNDFSGLVSNIEKGTEVELQANSMAPAENFLSFTRITPLGYLINNALDTASATGTWQIPLRLFIPVNEADNAKVSGTINIQDADFQFEPDYPWLKKMNGSLRFDETELVAQKLEGSMLGGPVTLDGNIGSSGKALSIKGMFTGEGLREMLSVKGMSRIKGQANYEARFDFLAGGKVNVQVNSSLQGLALDFPGEVGKAAAVSKPLRARWISAASKNNDNARVLELELGQGDVKAVFERDVRLNTGAFFFRGGIGILAAPSMPANGLKISAKPTFIDVQQWLDIVDEFDTGKTAGKPSQVFPDVSALQLDATSLRYLSQTIAQARVSGIKNPKSSAWGFRIDAQAVTGDIDWVPGKVAHEDFVAARFDRLALNSAAGGKEENNAQANNSTNKRLDLPRLDISAKRFLVFDKELGSLNLKGRKKNPQDNWQIDNLTINNAGGSLYATGALKTENNSTGLDLKLNLNFLDLGKLLSVLLEKTVVAGGKGHMNGALKWPDITDLDLNQIDLNLESQVTEGRLLSIDSKVAKALELLALQSIRRIPDFGSTLGNSFKDGVSFDMVRSRLEMKQGNMQVSDFRLSGPAVAIVASGVTNINTEALDFQAVVVPNLDISGAAILTGVIVNPVVGVGAFLSQWLLQAPLQRSLTARYFVRGTWSEPIINDAVLPTEEELKDKEASKKINDLYRSN